MKYESNRAKIDSAINEGLRRGVLAGAIHYQAAVKKGMSKHASNRGNGGNSSPAGGAPGVATGTLRRSVQIDVGGLIRGDRPHAKIGTNVEYAAIHEFGGTISASGGGLTVPIHPDAKRASAQGRSARDFPDLVLIKRHGKDALLVRDPGGSFDVMYVLKKSVMIPARPVWRPTFKREMGKIKNLIKRGLDTALKGVA